MNLFNRLVMAALALALLAVSVAALLVVTGALAPDAAFVGGPLGDAVRRLAALEGGDRTVTTLVAAVVALGALVLFWLEVRPPRRPRPFVVDTTALGRLTVEHEGVCRLAEKAATELREVAGCRTTLASGEEGAGVSARCVVTVTAGSVVRDVAGAVQDRVREVIETQAGLKVGAVAVRVRIGTAEPPPPARVIE